MKDLKEHLEFEMTEQFLIEMAQIGDIDNKLMIYVRSNDGGNIPHFHIVDKSTLVKQYHTCVMIEVAKYFHHTGKEGVLNSKQRKSLVEFLSKDFDEDTTNREYLIMTWNANNSKSKISKKLPMPNYLEL